MILDLVRTRAHEKGWALDYDSGPLVGGRTLRWKKETTHLLPQVLEFTVRFNTQGSIDFSEKTRDGEWFLRQHVMEDFTWTDVVIETLRAF